MLTRISGELTDEILVRHVVDLNGEAKEAPDLRELADCRELEHLERLTVQGTANAAALETPRPESLLAILVPDANALLYGMARVYQTFSVEKRREVRILKNLDEALAWLGGDDAERAVLKGFVTVSESAEAGNHPPGFAASDTQAALGGSRPVAA